MSSLVPPEANRGIGRLPVVHPFSSGVNTAVVVGGSLMPSEHASDRDPSGCLRDSAQRDASPAGHRCFGYLTARVRETIQFVDLLDRARMTGNFHEIVPEVLRAANQVVPVAGTPSRGLENDERLGNRF